MRTMAFLFCGLAVVACSGSSSTGVPSGSSSSGATSSSGGSSGTSSGAGSGNSCGGIAGVKCGAGEYCDYALEAACGASDQTGTCKATPQACDKIYSPVCGCDGATYGNACEANSKGTSVAKAGECGGAGGKVCGTRGAAPCAADEWCAYAPAAECGATDQGGTCEKKPTEPVACIEIYDPVCGCDGKTYGNDCEAHAAMTSVKSKGECTQ